MKFTLLFDKVLVRVIAREEYTPSGLYIPGGDEITMTGEVVGVGEGHRMNDGALVPMSVNVGDRVMFEKHSGREIKLGSDKYLILREEEIFGIIED